MARITALSGSRESRCSDHRLLRLDFIFAARPLLPDFLFAPLLFNVC
jgi:hypothetical protein